MITLIFKLLIKLWQLLFKTKPISYSNVYLDHPSCLSSRKKLLLVLGFICLLEVLLWVIFHVGKFWGRTNKCDYISNIMQEMIDNIDNTSSPILYVYLFVLCVDILVLCILYLYLPHLFFAIVGTTLTFLILYIHRYTCIIVPQSAIQEIYNILHLRIR